MKKSAVARMATPAGLRLPNVDVAGEVRLLTRAYGAGYTQAPHRDRGSRISAVLSGGFSEQTRHGSALCGIEEAYNQGDIDWKKPVSCHLYPVRVKDYSEFSAVNYHKWQICDDACTLGKELQLPIYKFVKEALIRKFGAEWYAALEKIADERAG